MMRLVYDKSFLKAATLLQASQRRKLAVLLEKFRDDPFNPLLHTEAPQWYVCRIFFFSHCPRLARNVSIYRC